MTGAVRLRPAHADDVPALAALYAGSAAALGPQVYTPAQVAAWCSFGAETPAFRDYVLGARTVVAEAVDAVDAAGTGPLGFSGIDDAGEVRSLYVRAGATRRGLGTRLLAHVLAEARSRGLHRFEAWVTPFSRPVFERAGFRVVEIRAEPYQGVMFERTRVRLD